MRDALGALGPVDGLNPELSNLTCRWRKVLYAIFISLPFSITEVLPGDIVFLTSDGISDNFDPVVNLNLILINKTFESPGAGWEVLCSKEARPTRFNWKSWRSNAWQGTSQVLRTDGSSFLDCELCM